MSTLTISNLIAFQILDSRGRPTVAASVVLADGSTHTARVPSGASTGKHEAKELRDFGTKFAETFFAGQSVQQAISNINEIIAPKLIRTEINLPDCDEILKILDPSSDHQLLGANATLAVSLAVAKASAHAEGVSLARYFQPEGALLIPMPMVNILSGGAHANRAMDIQDVLALPHGAQSFDEAIAWSVAIRECAARRGAKFGSSHLVADEGGLGLSFATIDAACEFVIHCIDEVGLKPGSDVSLALDIAATQFYSEGMYRLPTLNREFNSTQFVTFMKDLVSSHPIISIEDPFSEDDWSAWINFTASANRSLQILGDDLFTTNLERLNRGINEVAGNAILIKVNQNGLVSNTQLVLNTAKSANFKTVVSARSGETEDSWLADLAAGWRSEQIKVGSTHGAERTAKWNRLLELEATEKTIFAQPFHN